MIISLLFIVLQSICTTENTTSYCYPCNKKPLEGRVRHAFCSHAVLENYCNFCDKEFLSSQKINAKGFQKSNELYSPNKNHLKSEHPEIFLGFYQLYYKEIPTMNILNFFYSGNQLTHQEKLTKTFNNKKLSCACGEEVFALAAIFHALRNHWPKNGCCGQCQVNFSIRNRRLETINLFSIIKHAKSDCYKHINSLVQGCFPNVSIILPEDVQNTKISFTIFDPSSINIDPLSEVQFCMMKNIVCNSCFLVVDKKDMLNHMAVHTMKINASDVSCLICNQKFDFFSLNDCMTHIKSCMTKLVPKTLTSINTMPLLTHNPIEFDNSGSNCNDELLPDPFIATTDANLEDFAPVQELEDPMVYSEIVDDGFNVDDFLISDY